MFDQIVKLSIKNRWFVLIVFLFIGAFGVYNYFKLPIEPYRVCRRVNILRDYPDDKTKLYPRN
ncbi:hypothetical protein EGT42_08245 [Acinetobacter haemolyticus]|nr:hypothetical protein [Acinetobacter haemolyticus]RSC81386.1 hypothetical protein EGT42_08245 [Acinetobacter haemolyticus]